MTASVFLITIHFKSVLPLNQNIGQCMEKLYRIRVTNQFEFESFREPKKCSFFLTNVNCTCNKLNMKTVQLTRRLNFLSKTCLFGLKVQLKWTIWKFDFYFTSVDIQGITVSIQDCGAFISTLYIYPKIVSFQKHAFDYEAHYERVKLRSQRVRCNWKKAK